jgi:peptide/nickel transport system substrate-binding protein
MPHRSVIRPSSLLLLLLLLVLPGFGVAQTLTYGMGGNFDKLDPNVSTFTRVARITQHVVEPLIWQAAPGQFEPGLATAWSVNDDASEYTFTLRQGVTFHDGTPFNAEAVRFTFDRIVDPDSQAQTAFSLIGPYASTEILGEYEVKVVFSQPFAPFLDSASSPNLGIISPSALAAAGADEWGLTALVGTGPFTFTSYIADSEVVLDRNPDYWGGPEFMGGAGNIQQLVYLIIPEPSTRTASLETGETDFIEEVAAIDFGFLADNPDLVTVAEPQSGSGWSLMMNRITPPTDELAVRRAIQLASDREGMTLAIFNGIGAPGCGPISAVTFGYDATTCDVYGYDPEAAKQVLEEAGWVDSNGDGIRERDGQTLTLGHYYRAESALSQQLADYMKADLAVVGIEVELNGLSRSGYFDAVRAGEHNLQNWWDPFSDPDGVRILFHSDNAGGGTNRNNYVDAEMDQLIDTAAATTDTAERVELYRQIQQKVMDEAIMVFYNDPDTLYAYSNGLDGVLIFGAGQMPYFHTASVDE